jgi:hypothetical protein
LPRILDQTTSLIPGDKECPHNRGGLNTAHPVHTQQASVDEMVNMRCVDANGESAQAADLEPRSGNTSNNGYVVKVKRYTRNTAKSTLEM